jgi:hypothetical protein
MFDRTAQRGAAVLIVTGNPLDENQAIPVLLAVLLNNPNLRQGQSGQAHYRYGDYGTGLFDSIHTKSALDEYHLTYLTLNGPSVLFGLFDEIAGVNRRNRARMIEWLMRRREQACDDAVQIAQQQSQDRGSTH